MKKKKTTKSVGSIGLFPPRSVSVCLLVLAGVGNLSSKCAGNFEISLYGRQPLWVEKLINGEETVGKLVCDKWNSVASIKMKK